MVVEKVPKPFSAKILKFYDVNLFNYHLICDDYFFLSRQKFSSVRTFSISEKWIKINVHFCQIKKTFPKIIWSFYIINSQNYLKN
jgi:hypothetical protein